MGSTELAANLFRATQTEEKLRREKVRSKDLANQIHHPVGHKVRQTIRELGGTMPENLPVVSGGENGMQTGRLRMNRILLAFRAGLKAR